MIYEKKNQKVQVKLKKQVTNLLLLFRLVRCNLMGTFLPQGNCWCLSVMPNKQKFLKEISSKVDGLDVSN